MGCRLFVFVVWMCCLKLVCSERCTFYSAQEYELLSAKYMSVDAACDCSTGSLDCSSRKKTSFGFTDRCSDNVLVVNVSYNRIEYLPRTAFAKMSKLKMLLLNNNDLRELTVGLFCFLPELQMINLDWNQLKSLPQYIFSELRKLKNISLKNNKLSNISPNIFSALPVLEKLVLENNLLKRISPAAFVSSKKLQIINLRNNTLKSFPVGLFQEEISIDVLDLSENHLRSFASCHVAGLRNISKLNLSGNKLTSLPVLGNQPKVYVAIFSGNKIRTVTEHELRPWLEDGNSVRFMTLKDSFITRTTLLRNLSSLTWILEDSKLQVSSDDSCNCGTVKHGKAKVEFCVDVECGDDQVFQDWKDAVRYARCQNSFINDTFKCKE